MSAKLLGLTNRAAVLAVSTSMASDADSVIAKGDPGWDLTLDLSCERGLSNPAPQRSRAPQVTDMSALKLANWMFTYAPSVPSTVEQFTLDSSNSNVEVLYCDSDNRESGQVEMVIRICCMGI